MIGATLEIRSDGDGETAVICSFQGHPNTDTKKGEAMKKETGFFQTEI